MFAAHALCLTAAFELSLACDLLLAAESARFGLVETVVGLTPAMGGTQRLAERAGPARARELVMTASCTTPRRSSAGTSSTACCPTRASTRRRARSPGAWPRGRRGRTRRRRRSSAPRSRAGRAPPTSACPRWPAALFATEDLRGAVRSFLEHGPGHATYRGR